MIGAGLPGSCSGNPSATMSDETPQPTNSAASAPPPDPTAQALPAVADEAGNLIEIVGRFSGPGEPIIAGDVQTWLLGEGRRMTKDPEFFDALCRRLLGAGLPIGAPASRSARFIPSFSASISAGGATSA